MIALTSLLCLVLVSVPANSGRKTPVFDRKDDPQPSACQVSLQVALNLIGISPRSLAVIGASDAQVEQIASIGLAECETGLVDIQPGLDHQAMLNAEISRLSDHVSSGVASAAERARLPLARVELSNVLAQQAYELNTLRDSVIGILDDDQQTKLGNIMAAKEVDVPLASKVVARTEQGWVTTRNSIGTSAENQPSDVATATALLAERGQRLAEVWNAVFGQ